MALKVHEQPFPGDATEAEKLEFLSDHADDIKQRLATDGAVLLRKFGVDSATALAEAMDRLFAQTLQYRGGNSPRTSLGNNVYTSTEFPADQHISLHSELSYMDNFPQYIAFCCSVAAQEGGATPIADNRDILQAVPEPLVDRLRDKELAYTQKLHGGAGFGKSWQQTFENEDFEEVQAFLQANDIEHEWKDDGGLFIRYRRPATIKHKEASTEVWFNQAEQWHPSLLQPEIRMMLEATFDPEDMPHNVFFADGNTISDEDCEAIRSAQSNCAYRRDWDVGDLLLLDNTLVCHGRDPFAGARKVLVSMAW